MKKYFYVIIIFLMLFFGLILLFPEQAEIIEENPRLLSKENLGEIKYTTTSEQPKLALAQMAALSTEQKEGTELTIYNQNFGLVKDIRKIFLEKGLNLIEYRDVSSRIDPTSVLFKDLKHDSFVVEQNYEYDLISKRTILEKYLDKEITVVSNGGETTKEYTGILLSYNDGIIIQTNNEIIILDPEKIIFPKIPENLRTKPTLVWQLYTNTRGERNTETSYLTDGLNWHAEYIANINENDTRMDFQGWVSIDNQTGTSYPNTSLKLVAGDIHRVTTQPRYSYEMYDMISTGYSPRQFEEESLFEYHMYTLERKTDILNKQKKQISLLSSENIPVKKILFYDGARQGNKVQVKIQFENKEESGLGIPLPKGKVRVYKQDSEGKQQFIGEDLIDHTPRNEDTTLLLGNAFDIIGERKQTFNQNIAKGLYKTSYEITLRNQKDVDEEIVVHEYVGRSWTITQKSHDFEQKSSSEIEFVVKVPANGETTITYTIEHRYYF